MSSRKRRPSVPALPRAWDHRAPTNYPYARLSVSSAGLSRPTLRTPDGLGAVLGTRPPVSQTLDEFARPSRSSATFDAMASRSEGLSIA